jgi:hypothetical protein
MVKKLGILGFILIVVAAAGMVWAETYTGAIPAPQPMVMPAAAPPMCGVRGCPPPVVKMKAPKCAPKMTTVIDVKMQYPAPPPMCPPPMCGPVGCAPPPPIPVAVPMWKFIVPWPPFVYYLPVE